MCIAPGMKDWESNRWLFPLETSTAHRGKNSGFLAATAAEESVLRFFAGDRGGSGGVEN
ncbi:hypothetical protein Acr_24g0013570 [Actinidia rufa]|uniref:Uncharacterized protein n=1 Tax=Actinidia rufa TaxID=165716 RepID=A0A7J0GWE4_9ERIC|nr:hypothetical protein Acr_24g0013570 [Actinidia rufa]